MDIIIFVITLEVLKVKNHICNLRSPIPYYNESEFSLPYYISVNQKVNLLHEIGIKNVFGDDNCAHP